MFFFNGCEWNTLGWIIIQDDHHRERKIREARRAERKAAWEAIRARRSANRARTVPRIHKKGREKHDAPRIADQAS